MVRWSPLAKLKGQRNNMGVFNSINDTPPPPKRAKRSRISVLPADKSVTAHRGTMIIEGIPQDTKQLFKAACARQDETMRDALIKLMRGYVKEHP